MGYWVLDEPNTDLHLIPDKYPIHMAVMAQLFRGGMTQQGREAGDKEEKNGRKKWKEGKKEGKKEERKEAKKGSEEGRVCVLLQFNA